MVKVGASEKASRSIEACRDDPETEACREVALGFEVLAMMFNELEVPRGTVGARRSGLEVTDEERVCLDTLRGGCWSCECERKMKNDVDSGW